MRTIENSLLVFNQGEDEQPGRQDDLSVAPEKPALKRPARYRVVLLNDDYTPMDFVVDVLMKFFGMNEEKATQVMLLVHTQGSCMRGIYPGHRGNKGGTGEPVFLGMRTSAPLRD